MTDPWDVDVPQVTAAPSTNTKSPLWIAFMGIGLVLTVLAAGILDDPAKIGLGAWKGYLFYWLLSLFAYLVPFGFFVMRDLAVRSAVGWRYSTSKQLVSTLRVTLLVLGMAVSSYFMFGLATDLATLTGGN